MNKGMKHTYFFQLMLSAVSSAEAMLTRYCENQLQIVPSIHDKRNYLLHIIDQEWYDRACHNPQLANANRFQGIVGFWNAYTLLLNVAHSDQDSTIDSAALLRRLWQSYTAYEIQIPFHEWCELPRWIVRIWNRFEITAYKLTQLYELQEHDSPAILKIMRKIAYRYDPTVAELCDVHPINEAPFMIGVGQ